MPPPSLWKPVWWQSAAAKAEAVKAAAKARRTTPTDAQSALTSLWKPVWWQSAAAKAEGEVTAAAKDREEPSLAMLNRHLPV